MSVKLQSITFSTTVEFFLFCTIMKFPLTVLFCRIPPCRSIPLNSQLYLQGRLQDPLLDEMSLQGLVYV